MQYHIDGQVSNLVSGAGFSGELTGSIFYINDMFDSIKEANDTKLLNIIG